jgi:dihydroneopterin aldolase
MDIVFIEGLAIETTIGCLNWERHIKQKVVLDIEMTADCQKAAASDDITHALNYALVAERVTEFVATSQFHLIEALAENVVTIILTEFPCSKIKFRLKKPGAIPQAQTVGILIERSK